MVSRTVLAIAIGVWTLVAWGGRVRLLTGAEQADLGNRVRIGGSLLLGGTAVAVLLLSVSSSWERWILTLFAAWSTVLWARSLIVVWPGNQSMAFKVVHTALAAGFFVLAYLDVRRGWSPAS
jgi:hypothetical protein